MAEIVPYLQALIQKKGSDLHLSTSSKPMLRINGDMVPLANQGLEREKLERMISEILNPKQREMLQNEKQVDFAIKVKGLGVFRLNVFQQHHGLAVAIRALTEKPPTIDQVGLPEIFKRSCHYANGLILVTGPTGSGKSTSLAAMIDYINTTSRGHIITLEDPIEFFHESKSSMVNQRQLGLHFSGFSHALKAALREDPDVILVGEMRDIETISMAITAAETGHLVFATLHTSSAAKSIDRIIDSFPAEQQNQIRSMLADSLRVIVSQKLIPRKDGRGRIPFFDILVVNPAVSNLIREGKIFQIPSIMQMNRQAGMQLIDQSLYEAAKRDIVDGQVAWEAANDKSMLEAFAPREMRNIGPGTQVSTLAKKTG